MAAPLSFSSSLFALFSKRLVVAVAPPPPLQQVVYVIIHNVGALFSFLRKHKIYLGFKRVLLNPKHILFGNAKKKGVVTKGPIYLFLSRSAKKEEEEEEEEEGKEREGKRWTKRRSRNSTRPWNRKQPRPEDRAGARAHEDWTIAITCKQTGEIIPLVNFSNLREELAEILGPHLVDWEDEGKRELLFRNCKP